MSDTAAVVEPATEPVSEPVGEPAKEPAKEPVADNVIWREEWAKRGDPDQKELDRRLKRLGRWDHPGRLFDSYLELEKAHKAADIRTPFPAEGSDKDKANWRKDNGIPDEPAGYWKDMPEGLNIAKDDQEGMDHLAKVMHDLNASPEVTHGAARAYNERVQLMLEQRAELDQQGLRDRDEALQELYGVNTKGHTTRLDSWLDAAPEGVKDMILNSRMDDGTPLANDPKYMEWLIGVMHKVKPFQTVAGLGEGDPALALQDEIAAIEKVIQTDNRAYRSDETMRARYLTLLEARDKNK